MTPAHFTGILPSHRKASSEPDKCPQKPLVLEGVQPFQEEGFPFSVHTRVCRRTSPSVLKRDSTYRSFLSSQAPAASRHLGSCRPQKDVNLPHILVPLGPLSSVALFLRGVLFYSPQGLVSALDQRLDPTEVIPAISSPLCPEQRNPVTPNASLSIQSQMAEDFQGPKVRKLKVGDQKQSCSSLEPFLPPKASTGFRP